MLCVLDLSSFYANNAAKLLRSLYQIGLLSSNLMKNLHNGLCAQLNYSQYVESRGTPQIEITGVIKVLIVVVEFQNLILQTRTVQSNVVSKVKGQKKELVS